MEKNSRYSTTAKQALRSLPVMQLAAGPSQGELLAPAGGREPHPVGSLGAKCQVKKATSAAVAKVYSTLGRRSSSMDQCVPQPPATMACQMSKGGLVLRVPSSSDCSGNQWPLSEVMRAMWM